MTAIQSDATAGGDIVGRDKITNYLYPDRQLSKLEKLKARLQQEVDGGIRAPARIEQLLTFQKPFATDGVVGLEAKLEVSGRSAYLLIALEMKEEFAKLLERWSLYASAQEIFVHLLARAEYKFSHQVLPNLTSLNHIEFDQLLESAIIAPTIEEVGIDVFMMDHRTSMGMIYWLAEQCRIRWHQ